MPRAKRHHFFPQFHHRFFGVGLDRSQIWVYDKRTDQIALRAIKDTEVIGNYYTVHAADGPTDALEKAFAGIEAEAVPPGLREFYGLNHRSNASRCLLSGRWS